MGNNGSAVYDRELNYYNYKKTDIDFRINNINNQFNNKNNINNLELKIIELDKDIDWMLKAEQQKLADTSQQNILFPELTKAFIKNLEKNKNSIKELQNKITVISNSNDMSSITKNPNNIPSFEDDAMIGVDSVDVVDIVDNVDNVFNADDVDNADSVDYTTSIAVDTIGDDSNNIEAFNSLDKLTTCELLLIILLLMALIWYIKK